MKMKSVKNILAFIVLCNISAEAKDLKIKLYSAKTCKKLGFNSFSLSCSTCDLFTKSADDDVRNALKPHYINCTNCCSDWIPSPEELNEKAKYTNAVFSYDPIILKSPALSNLADFFNKDLPEIEKSLDPKATFLKKKLITENAFTENYAMISFFNTNSEAHHEVVLDNDWEREDLKDMILSFLPTI